jgi:hypothetical protein
MRNSDEYRRKGEALVRIAGALTDAGRRAQLLAIAQSYFQIAERAELLETQARRKGGDTQSAAG